MTIIPMSCRQLRAYCAGIFIGTVGMHNIADAHALPLAANGPICNQKWEGFEGKHRGNCVDQTMDYYLGLNPDFYPTSQQDVDKTKKQVNEHIKEVSGLKATY